MRTTIDSGEKTVKSFETFNLPFNNISYESFIINAQHNLSPMNF